MADYADYRKDPTVPRDAHRTEPVYRETGARAGWLWAAVAIGAVVLLLAIMVFGAGDGVTTVEHPGGATVIEDTAPAGTLGEQTDETLLPAPGAPAVPAD